jgi:hypothetical protein
MKTLNPLKAPFGTGRFSRIRDVRYRQWDDAFEVAFDDGLSFLEPHRTIRRANHISRAAVVQEIEMDQELRSGFFVKYDTGEVAEVSWAFVRELPPKNVRVSASLNASSRRIRKTFHKAKRKN